MSRPTLRSCFIALAIVIAGLHLVSVTLAALPPNRYSDAVRDQTAYLDPYFTQNWRLFAPKPISEDRSVWFQGAYIDADGSAHRTEWVDWTAIELDLVRHRFVGGRAGYVTNKLVTPLMARSRALTEAQRRAATRSSQAAPPTWRQLGEELEEAGGRASATAGFLRYEQATTRLASDVLQAQFPDVELTAVRYSTRRQGVVPYEQRGGSAAERAVARPTVVEEVGGWRRPSPGPADERASVRDFGRRHR